MVQTSNVVLALAAAGAVVAAPAQLRRGLESEDLEARYVNPQARSISAIFYT